MIAYSLQASIISLLILYSFPSPRLNISMLLPNWNHTQMGPACPLRSPWWFSARSIKSWQLPLVNTWMCLWNEENLRFYFILFLPCKTCIWHLGYLFSSASMWAHSLECLKTPTYLLKSWSSPWFCKMGKYWLLLLLGGLSSVKEKYFSLLLASIELLRTQHHGEEGASAHSLSGGLWQRESKVASWESGTTVKPLAVKDTYHLQCDPRTLRTCLMHYDKTPKGRRTG